MRNLYFFIAILLANSISSCNQNSKKEEGKPEISISIDSVMVESLL